MKRIYTIIVAVLITASVFAQAPQKMTYQAVVRDASNNLVTSTQVGIEINILEGSATGTQVYTETQTPTTNVNGLLTIEIGGQTGFDTITWANGPYFLETNIDPTGGSTYSITGISQLLTVPYALHAKTAESITGGIMETDPIFNNWDKSTGISITESQITDLQSYLTTEVDGSVTNEIQDLSEVLTENNSAGTQIKDLIDPTDAQDAATKVYVDQMMQIMENNGLTVVDFTADNTSITVSGTVNFTDNSAINPTTWAWDFGDGNSSAIQNPAHAYTTAGTYTVSLTASNGSLTKTESKTNYITVSVADLTDYDGNNYTSIIIGGQEWMAENLKVTHYPNGDAIPLITDNTTWGNLADDNTSDAYSYYDNSSANATTYGALYTYSAAIGDNWARDNTANQGVCPDGWHLPTSAEWTTLTNYLGGTSVAGGKMKEIGTTHWNSPNSGADNSSGFSALPSGSRNYGNGTFNGLGSHGYWWSATESGSLANTRNLHYYDPNVSSYNYNKSYGFSVRCVRD